MYLGLLLMCAFTLTFFLTVRVSVERDDQVRNGLVILKYHQEAHLSFISKSISFRPETWYLRIKGNRADTGEQRIIVIEVGKTQFDRFKVGNQWKR